MMSFSRFSEFMLAIERSLGAVVDYINPDGRIHRFRTPQDRPGDTSGWYVFFPDGWPSGAYGDWRAGTSFRWRATSTRPMPAWCRAKSSEITARRKAKTVADQRRRQSQAVVRAQSLWASAHEPDSTHPYLRAKQVPPYGLRQYGAALVVPIQFRGRICNLQRIYPDGRKRYLPGGRVKGGYCEIGPGGSHHLGKLWVCEGWATGATLFHLSNCPVLCALSAHNLPAVATEAQGLYPGHQIVVAADNDRFTAGNPGVAHALKAAEPVGAEVVLPIFPDGSAGTDFSDLYMLSLGGER